MYTRCYFEDVMGKQNDWTRSEFQYNINNHVKSFYSMLTCLWGEWTVSSPKICIPKLQVLSLSSLSLFPQQNLVESKRCSVKNNV